MGEVLAVVRVDDPGVEETLASAMAARRWSATGTRCAFVCHFEHGFQREIRDIVLGDLIAATAQAGLDRWDAAYAWSPIPHRAWFPEPRISILATSSSGIGPSDVWADGPSPVGPLGDVLVALDAPLDDGSREAMLRRGWAPLLPTAWRHRFDLGMFGDLGPRVARDLHGACGDGWRASWVHSTFPSERLASRAPREARRLPWDEP